MGSEDAVGVVGGLDAREAVQVARPVGSDAPEHPRAARARPGHDRPAGRTFGLTLNGLKKHVGILEDVDLVITNKVGRARECRLGPAQLQEATDWIEDYRRMWEARLDRFGEYVEKRKASGG